MSYRWKNEPQLKERARLVAREYGVAHWSSLHLKNIPRPIEVRKRISAAHLGMKLSEATKEKLRRANLGRKTSLETRRKMSLSRIRFLSKRVPKATSALTLDSFIARSRGGRTAIPWAPDDTMIPHIAYIMGVIEGDGYTTKHYTVGMAVTDKPFADSFAESLCKIGLSPRIHVYEPHNGVSKLPLWRVVAHSKMFYEWLDSMPEDRFQEIIEKYPREFIRGFYESEGLFHKSKQGRGIVSFYNTNPDLLIRVANILTKLGFHPSRMYTEKNGRASWNSKNVHCIRLIRQAEPESFLEVINPVIKRGNGKS